MNINLVKRKLKKLHFKMKIQNTAVSLNKEDFDPTIFDVKNIRSNTIKFIPQVVEGWIEQVNVNNVVRVMLISNLIWKKLK